MGYILPLNQEQYTQYANRTIRKDVQPFTLIPVQKPTIRTKLKGKTIYEERYNALKLQRHDGDEKQKIKKVNPDVIDYCVANLTGKGTLFNEVI